MHFLKNDSMEPRILVFTGSNCTSSITIDLTDYAAGIVKDIPINRIELRDYMAPVFSTDIWQEKGVPESIQKLRDEIDRHDGFIIGLPEHNGSMTALLKNTIDWLSVTDMKFFKGKPVLLLSASEGRNGGKTGLDHVANILPFLGAKIIGDYSLGRFSQRVEMESGFQFREEVDQRQLESLVEKLSDNILNPVKSEEL